MERLRRCGGGLVYAAFAGPRLAHEAGPQVAVVAIGDFKGDATADRLVQSLKASGLLRQIYRVWEFLKDLFTSRKTVEAAA